MMKFVLDKRLTAYMKEHNRRDILVEPRVCGT